MTAPRIPVALALVLAGAVTAKLAAAPLPVAPATVTLAAAASLPVTSGGGAMPPEPQIPPACATLVATKKAVNGTLAPADENQPDTTRIQEAIKTCPAGQSVKLTRDGAKDAFLSGPLKMASGVSLWVDAGTTLFASRNPRDYDREAGAPTCGTDKFDDSNGCQPSSPSRRCTTWAWWATASSTAAAASR